MEQLVNLSCLIDDISFSSCIFDLTLYIHVDVLITSVYLVFGDFLSWSKRMNFYDIWPVFPNVIQFEIYTSSLDEFHYFFASNACFQFISGFLHLTTFSQKMELYRNFEKGAYLRGCAAHYSLNGQCFFFFTFILIN